MQKARGHPLHQLAPMSQDFHSLQIYGFRYYFTRLIDVLFNFPSRYLCTIGCLVVFSLGPWSGRIPTGFHVSGSTWELDPNSLILFVYRTITVFDWPFQNHSTKNQVCNCPLNPYIKPIKPRNFPHETHTGYHACGIQAVPRSFATTRGINVFFFSTGYLDVSILLVWLPYSMYSSKDNKV